MGTVTRYRQGATETAPRIAAMVREGAASARANRKTPHSGRILGVRAVSGERVRVTRTDIGTRNGRLTATAAERAPHGAVNATSTATEPDGLGGRYTPGNQTPLAYVATHDPYTGRPYRNDALESERPAQRGTLHRHGGCECPHENPVWSV